MGMSKPFDTVFCTGEYYPINDDQYDMTIVGTIKEPVKGNTIYYFASNPPDYRATYTGSGLPFANQNMAYENSPNKGKTQLIDNSFEIKLMYPNSYYVGLGTVLVPPTVFVEYFNTSGEKRNVSIKLSDGIPYRMLTYPMSFTLPRKDAMFYNNHHHLPVRTQEQVLRDSAYPSVNRMPDNFWGLKPAL